MKKIESQTVWAIVNFEAQEAQDIIVQAFWDEGEANNALEEMENANSDQYLYAGDVIHFKLPIHELQAETQSLTEEIKELKAENERRLITRQSVKSAAEQIIYLPVTNGKSEQSIQFGTNLIQSLIDMCSHSLKAENERLKEALEQYTGVVKKSIPILDSSLNELTSFISDYNNGVGNPDNFADYQTASELADVITQLNQIARNALDVTGVQEAKRQILYTLVFKNPTDGSILKSGEYSALQLLEKTEEDIRDHVCICDCQPTGESSYVECNCQDYYDDFEFSHIEQSTQSNSELTRLKALVEKYEKALQEIEHDLDQLDRFELNIPKLRKIATNALNQ